MKEFITAMSRLSVGARNHYLSLLCDSVENRHRIAKSDACDDILETLEDAGLVEVVLRVSETQIGRA